MFFLVIGILALAAGFAINTPALAFSHYARPVKLLGIIAIIIGLLTSSVRQIDAGQVGVVSLFGNVSEKPINSGLSFVNPLANVTEFDIKTQNYTMSANNGEGDKQGDDAIRVLTADGLEVVIDLTVLYRVVPNDAPAILREIGPDYTDKIVRPITRTRIRDNAVYYDAVALYSTRRDEFQGRIYKTIEADFKKRGLMLEQLLIRNIDLPASVKKTIESKINAEQDSQKMQFVLTKERQEAERKRVEAQGIADYQKILSTGLSDRQLQYEQIKAQRELAASPNAKIIIMGSRGNVPLILSDK
ncbi:prohibitin family protein [Spirosoma utsteinense]|uniref:Regulator of protease activity HflC (Stomatin/prohibitin superfamily) n=1 Tax=Spirosoma utsteinense TaxID=2585773 RepID=A0ABR6W4T5_9BACT|nr:prohibitin family protein [Spirosoma utsteinense]MBC3785355.1 regulator of protease activity HflC (stomatin/prohibitin superfamily) [Spirosoma utsteinense]MBC3791618.1 regulator of protease activity HflC (stomatin/prohibitin superfamily) [Spirosoma utsteinense]